MPVTKLLARGDLVPHLTLRCADGSTWDYAATTWQRRNLLLLCLPWDTDVTDVIYVDALLATAPELMRFETTWVLTRDAIDGVPMPGVLIADKWGEIYCVATAARVSGLPTASEILEWLRYIESECPECQGEVR